MCELYKDTLITIRINRNIFYGPIKRMWQTYHDKVIEVFYNGEWFPAKIIAEESSKDIFKINDTLQCSLYLKLKTPNGDKTIYELEDGVLDANPEPNAFDLCVNIYDINSIAIPDNRYIKLETKFEKSDWLFGIEFTDPNNQYYTLTNGYIVSTK